MPKKYYERLSDHLVVSRVIIYSLCLSSFFGNPTQQLNMPQNSPSLQQIISTPKSLFSGHLWSYVVWCVTTTSIQQLQILLHSLLCWELTNMFQLHRLASDSFPYLTATIPIPVFVRVSSIYIYIYSETSIHRSRYRRWHACIVYLIWSRN
jgi:hypothetical protein